MDWRVALYQLPVPSDLFLKILAFHDPVIEHVLKRLDKRVREHHFWTGFAIPIDEYTKLIKDALHVIRTAESVEKLDELF